jgi:pilus assembly protein FimV
MEFEIAPSVEPEEMAPTAQDLSMALEPATAELTEVETAEPFSVPELAVDLEAIEAEEVPEFHIEAEAPEILVEEVTQPSEPIELELPAEGAPAEEISAMPGLDFGDIDLELMAEAPVLEQAGAVAEQVLEAVPEAVEPVAAPALEKVPGTEIDPALWEEVNTKLDLARAYLEMGDREGAREILQEVTQEGDSIQKVEANKLLAQAG